MAAWNTQPCFTPTFINHRVGEQDIKFYPVSLGMMFKLKAIATPIARSITTLFSKKDEDTTRRIVSLKSGDSETHIGAVSTELATFRDTQQVEAIGKLVETLTDAETLKVLGEIVMDSMRELFPPGSKKDWPPAAEFCNTVPLPAFGQMLVGVCQANKDVLGPLGETVKTAVGSRLAEVVAKGSQPSETPTDG